jgi:uncharacterized protein (DUF4415 family)
VRLQSEQPVVLLGAAARSNLKKHGVRAVYTHRGAVVSQKGKTRISIYIDNDVLEEFRSRADESGKGYQTMMNEALRAYGVGRWRRS